MSLCSIYRLLNIYLMTLCFICVEFSALFEKKKLYLSIFFFSLINWCLLSSIFDLFLFIKSNFLMGEYLFFFFDLILWCIVINDLDRKKYLS